MIPRGSHGTQASKARWALYLLLLTTMFAGALVTATLTETLYESQCGRSIGGELCIDGFIFVPLL